MTCGAVITTLQCVLMDSDHGGTGALSMEEINRILMIQLWWCLLIEGTPWLADGYLGTSIKLHRQCFTNKFL